MANRIDVTKIQGDTRYLIYHVYLESDGAAGDLDSFVLVDPVADLGLAPGPRFSVSDVLWTFNGFVGQLHFEELVDDKQVWVLPSDSGNSVHFEPFGGLYDRSNPLDGTGKLMLSTIGFSAVGDIGSMLLKVKLRS